MKLIVVCPHFAPDTAPTGTVMTRIVAELAELGHELHVVTALPWYAGHRVESRWAGRWIRTEATSWGSITRVHPFPGSDKRNLVRRAVGFVAFSALALIAALRAGGWFRRVDAVLAMSPPLTLGATGWAVGAARRAPLVFNIQDVFPDAAVRTGAITNARVIRIAAWLERWSYRRSAAVTVLSDDLRRNVTAKLPPADHRRVYVIPNFVDTDAIRPADRATSYRSELGIGDEPVVLYAGNVGFSQSLDLVVEAARRCPDITFVVNGDGAARPVLEADAADLENVRFAGYQPSERLAEVLATGDVHVVPLRAGLGDVSVPSKVYSSLAAARPVVAAIDPGTAIPALLEQAGAGVTVPPDDVAAFTRAVRDLADDPARARRLGDAGRRWAVESASPTAVGAAYHQLIDTVASLRRR
ncbi:MAG: glycosyltransferase family 4 protein [Ilumatobacter sp.]|nr:glycosyltransferase family 4 protein [Ilumatobacter sp.]